MGLAATKFLRHNIPLIAASLRSREAWRYAKAERLLAENGIKHQFEFPLGSYIYDLCLPDLKLLVEFDGLDHSFRNQRILDAKRDASATSLGWSVKRLVVNKNEVIPAEVLHPVISVPA